MKLIISVVLLNLASLSQAEASGCGRYDSYREITKIQYVKVLDEDEYLIKSRTPKTITLEKKDTGEQIVLGWEKTELLEKSEDYNQHDGAFLESFVGNDVLFEEGNGCGPVFRCVTGQIKMQVYIPKQQELLTYSYPVINEVSDRSWIRYVMSNSLLPVFGGLSLDVTSFKDEGGSNKDVLNSRQCGYGTSW